MRKREIGDEEIDIIVASKCIKKLTKLDIVTLKSAQSAL